MSNSFYKLLLICAVIPVGYFNSSISCSGKSISEKSKVEKVKLGAWYFGGWSFPPDEKGYTFHISHTLVNKYSDREPVWGWREDKPGVMQEQINYAAQNGLSVWGFCWYENSLNPTNEKLMDHLNTALNLFLQSNNRNLLDFFLLSCSPVSPKNWVRVCDRTISYFKESNYLRIDDKPVVCFFNADEVISGMGGIQKTKEAIQLFRERARKAGYNDILIGARTFPRASDPAFQNKFQECGFDFLTTYCNADDGRRNAGANDYQNLLEGDRKSWNEISDNTSLPFLPVVDAGYDMRPWAHDHPTLPSSDYWYTGVTPSKIASHVKDGILWLKDHHSKTLGNLLMIYAWNENGEGGWLTPTKAEGEARLNEIKKVIDEENNRNN